MADQSISLVQLYAKYKPERILSEMESSRAIVVLASKLTPENCDDQVILIFKKKMFSHEEAFQLVRSEGTKVTKNTLQNDVYVLLIYFAFRDL